MYKPPQADGVKLIELLPEETGDVLEKLTELPQDQLATWLESWSAYTTRFCVVAPCAVFVLKKFLVKINVKTARTPATNIAMVDSFLTRIGSENHPNTVIFYRQAGQKNSYKLIYRLCFFLLKIPQLSY